MFVLDATLLVLLIGALAVGLAKTAFGGLGLVSAALFASVLPARESTGTLLLVLILGDIIAIYLYRSHVEWRVLARLSPSVVVGVLSGVLVLAAIDDAGLRKLIGGLVLFMVVGHLAVQRMRRTAEEELTHLPRPITHAFGALAGLTSMVANAGGPVMTVYLLNMELGVLAFIGTNAWFFAGVNLLKLPFSTWLGLVSTDALALLAVLAPAVAIGAYLGRLLMRRLNQRTFQTISLVSATVVGLNLLLR